MKKTHLVASAIALSLSGIGSAGSAPSSNPVVQAPGGLRASEANSIVEWYAPWNRFYLDSNEEQAVMDFKTDRDVRICDDVRAHGIALMVHYDDKSTNVQPGHCFQFEAKRVSIKPAENLPAGMSLSGRLEQVPSH
jgi:hypothetical protein